MSKARTLRAEFDVDDLTEKQAVALAGYVEAQAEGGNEGEYPAVHVHLTFDPPFEPTPVRGFTVVLVDDADGSEGDFVYVEAFASADALEADLEDVSRRVLAAARESELRDWDNGGPGTTDTEWVAERDQDEREHTI